MLTLKIRNEGVEDWRGCYVSLECDDYSDAPTAKPRYEASELTPQGGAEVVWLPAPEVRAVGAVASGSGAISPALPAGTDIGDLLLMVAESGGATAAGEATPALTAAGWAEPLNHGSVKRGNTRLTVLYRIATGEDPTTTNDTGDHQLARIIGIKAGTFDPVEPFNNVGIAGQSATKAVSILGIETYRDNCLIVACASGNLPDSNTSAEFSAVTNASLTSLTERIDNTTAEGDGGAIFAATGVKAAAGAYAATTVTAATEAERAVLSLAVNPAADSVKCPPLTAGWVTVLSSEIDGEGHMTHIGGRRMLFRLEDPSTETDAARVAAWEASGRTANGPEVNTSGVPRPEPMQVQWKLEWRALGAAAWMQTQEGSTPIVKVSPVAGDYQLIDMGGFTIPTAITGDQRWEWRLQACVPAAGPQGSLQPLIRDVYPMSTEQWMRVSDTSDNPIDGEPVALGNTVENTTGVGSVAWKPYSGSGSMSFAEGSQYPTIASMSAATNYLKVTNFGFEYLVPEGADIRGVIARAVPFEASGNIEERRVRIVVGGAIKEAEDKAVPGGGSNWYWNSPQTRSWGGVLDLWGLGTITRAQVVASDFGIALALGGPLGSPEETRAISFKRIEMIVAYSEGGNENRVCFAGRSMEYANDGVRREHVTDDVLGELVPEGFLPYAPAPGQTRRPMRVLVIPTVGDFGERADSAAANLSAKVSYRPGYLFAREAAETEP